MKYLKSIGENSEFSDSIETLKEIEDIFYYLSDQDFDVQTFYIKRIESAGNLNSEKYNIKGNLVSKTKSPLNATRSKNTGLTKDKFLLICKGEIDPRSDILEFCRNLTKSISIVMDMTNLDLSLTSSIWFWYGQRNSWKSFFIDDIEDDPEILDDFIEEISKLDRIGVRGRTSGLIGVDICIEFMR